MVATRNPRRQLVLQPESQPAQPGLHSDSGRVRGGEEGDGEQGALVQVAQGRPAALERRHRHITQAREAKPHQLAQDRDGVARAGQLAATQPAGDAWKLWGRQNVRGITSLCSLM